MKNKKLFTAITALLTSALLASAMPLAAFAEGEAAETSTTEIVIENDASTTEKTEVTLKAGDKYAISKFNVKSNGDTLPGGYTLVQISEEQQQAVYSNNNSRIVVLAQNYNNTLQELDIFADSVCAMLRVRNFTSACDTIFQDPVESKVDGFRAIVYDYDILQYEFVDETTKNHIDTFKGRNYYFYSDDDAFAIMFDTNDEDWEEQSKCLEEFVKAVDIEGSDNSPNVAVIVVIAAIVVAVVAAAVIVVGKKKKKAE